MRAQILKLTGEKKSEIELPKFFDQPIRKDLIKKAYEVEVSKTRHAYGTNPRAGKEVSAAGKIHRLRHTWKGSYGYGISRVPRKIMSARGNRFNWVGAFSPNTRGGRAAHPPNALKNWVKKMNEKEKMMAIKSLLATGASKELENKYNIKLPLIIENEITEIKKAKELKKVIEKICPYNVVLITDKEMKTKALGIKNMNVSNLSFIDLTSSGNPDKIIMFTENSIKHMEKLK